MQELAEHGVFLPYNMQGLTDEQIEELKLKDEWAEKCVPSGGSVFKKDEIGRRNGHGKSDVNVLFISLQTQIIYNTMRNINPIILSLLPRCPGRRKKKNRY